ncbi:hypothetical protein NDU88_002249 [Pleurodeles waltl]|uniref:Uncharacterized protein n=1 Tax=Pleurodeles waltl TaxID=8319 RepID=A0AAV7P947_PLEWA|nr:hypothetical protein NDU88_002249 [Pleurodeles waltl]
MAGAALRRDSLAGESSARPPNDHGAGIGARTTHRTGPATSSLQNDDPPYGLNAVSDKLELLTELDA